MLDTFILSIFIIILTSQASSIIKDPIPFGNERLNDFYFVKNGTIFHQFVCIILIFNI
jgi:hypothetical protein